MSFVNYGYFFYVLIAAIVFAFLMYKYEKKFFNWIKLYWNLERTKVSRASSILYILSITLMLIGLLDLRGPEEQVKTTIPDQKTIIILDSSASMLAEDIKPNRFSKSIQLARHFVKNSPGHQIAVVLFSDIQKRLMPFTDDIDLLDSRLAALDKTNSISGGSNIAQAIMEATGYFQTENDQVGKGNILVFTDAEESEGFDLKLSDNINLAIVGVGTAKGSNIPIRWDDGSFRGYKTSNGHEVITKLDENYIKSLGKNVESYKYWIVNSYSLPTLEIVDFFRSKFANTLSEGNIKIRPVYSHYILIPATLIYVLSVFLGRFKTFKSIKSLALLFLMIGSSNAMASENKKEEKQLPEYLVRELSKLQEGNLNRDRTLKIGEYFLNEKDPKRASLIYKEYSNNEDSVEVRINSISSRLFTDDINNAIEDAKIFFEDNKISEKNKDILRSNILYALNAKGSSGSGNQKNDQENQEQNQDQKEKNQQQNQDKKDQGDNQENDQKKSDSDGGDKQDENKKDDKSGKNDQSDENQKKPEDKDNDELKNNKDSNGEDDADEKNENNQPQTIEEKEKKISEQRKLIQTPAMIKQILNDDRDLQKRMMDTSTNEKGKSRDKKDW